MSGGLTITVEHDDERVLVAATGELDLATVPLLRESLEQCTSLRVDQIVLDLRQVEFIDSTGLRLLLTTNEQTAQRGIGLALMRGPAVAHLLELTRLTERFQLADEE